MKVEFEGQMCDAHKEFMALILKEANDLVDDFAKKSKRLDWERIEKLVPDLGYAQVCNFLLVIFVTAILLNFKKDVKDEFTDEEKTKIVKNLFIKNLDLFLGGKNVSVKEWL